MSHYIGIVLALVSIGVTTCKALPDLHKQMSPQQLQSIFHVDSPEAVPQYEVIQLLHHNNQEPNTHFNHYRRRKRSIETIQQLQEHNKSHEAHHVKKDLSKNPYYSELKSDSLAASHKNSVNEATKPIKDILEHKVSLNAFGKNVNLTLKQTQSLFKNGQLHRLPMWFADNEANTTTKEGINLEKIEDEHTHTSDTIGEVFQDEENMAAILMRRHEVTGDLVMEGSIGHDMVIKPLPHDFSPDHKEAHHVIFKRAADLSEHLSDFAFMEPDDLATSEKLEKLQNRHKRSAHRTTLDDIELEEELLEAEDGLDNDEFATHKRSKRQSPYIIYPEILVIVDYDGYRLHGGDNLQVKRYFISFWNGVDLRYRLLKGPRIRISIAGIIISRGRDATPYLERNRVGRDAIDSAAALTDMGKYLFRERRLPVYDIAVAITKYDMCRRRKGGRCTKGTAGFAYVGGACVVNKRLEKVNSVAIIEDTGGFSGIIVAAHEVGHLLGAVHDGSPPPSYLGGPGAQRCRWEDGYIMSDLRHTERGFRWSPCTVQSFHHFLNGDTATCLHNAPHEDSALGRSMPGTLLSLDAQCRRDRGTYACFKDERVCAQLFCFDAQTGYCVAYRPAAEGSSCGNSLHCLDGRCTPLPSNVIPNYGHQYRLGYKSNEAIGDDIETNSKKTDKSSNNNDDEEGEDDSSEEDEEDEEEDDDDEEEDESDNDNRDRKTLVKPEIVNDHDDDEQYLTEQIIEKTDDKTNFENNHIDLRNDNNVDETMLKVSDHENALDLNSNNNFTQNPLINLNTYQYLAQLWQNLQETSLTITTTTTKKPSLGSYITPDPIQLQPKGQGYVVVKTSTKTSVSSSSESKRSNLTTTPNNFKLSKQKPTQYQYHHTTLHNTITTTTPKPTTTTNRTTSTLIKSLRKQFQYYIKLLQDNNSNRNNRNLNNNNNYNSQTILPSKPYSNSHNNAASPTTTNDDRNNNNHDNDDEDNDDEGNGGEDNDESNETVEKQKRKLSIPFTTKTLQQQQQLKATPNPTTAMPVTTTTTTTTLSSGTSPRYGVKTSVSSTTTAVRNSPTPTFFEAYFKKLQNLNNRPTSTAAIATTTTEIPIAAAKNSKLKINKKIHTKNNGHSDDDDDDVDEESVTSFEAQFLKRTLNPTIEGGGDAFSSNTNTNPYIKNSNTKQKTNNNTPTTITTTTRTTSRSTSSGSGGGSSSSNSNFQKTLDSYNKEIDNFHNNESVTPQPPIYVTNYIGDNTQRLTSIVPHHQHQHENTATTALQKQQLQQDHQHNSHQQPSPQQFETLIFSSTTRRPKIKTQKLIRRLRTQIK